MDELQVALLMDHIDNTTIGGAVISTSPANRTARVRDFIIRHKHNEAALATNLPSWMYPPKDGEEMEMLAPQHDLNVIRGTRDAPKHKLGEWPSTAICGNDILASCLYSSGIVSVKAGKLTPVTQILVSIVLYFFRYIYEEAVTAIPLNGGSYNVLLNTTSKRTAAVAATLGIISYLATGVVSGTSALQYLNTQIDMPIVGGTIALLLLFAVLSIIGIAESSTVALVIFIFHVLTLTLLSGFSAVYAFTNPEIFWNNMKTDFPKVDVAGTLVPGNIATALFFGYASAMLGITGFETSAQFVEEQASGVFRKTLRNMWVSATFYNILLSFLSLGVLPLDWSPDGIYANRDVVLARMGLISSGKWLERWVSIDAFIVLAGGVLTSYVGITGLVRRLAYDRVLPNFLTHTNAWRGTNHSIILLFFALQSSLVIILNANASVLAGVFTFAFLGVMSLFAFGCMLLKLKRQEIPRDVHAPWWSCIFGLFMVLFALLGNILGDPTILTYFALYFIIFSSVMFVMLERVFLLRILLYFLQQFFPSKHREDGKNHHTGARGGRTITSAIESIHLPPIVFFIKVPDLALLNRAILYVRTNEQTHNLRIVHIYDESHVSDQTKRKIQDLKDMVTVFDLMYPKLKIDFVAVGVPDGIFDPASVEWISHELQVPPNMMFIRQPGNTQIHQVSTLGVRVITN